MICLRLLLMLPSLATGASGADDSERLVKAAYLYNFGVYTRWPREIKTFRIGVLDEDAFADVLVALADAKKTIQDKRIEVVRFSEPDQVSECEILFLPSGREFEKVAEKVKGKGVLLVTHEAGLGERGSMINFYLDAGKVKFEINRQTLDQEKLRVDYRVLSLGKMVGEARATAEVGAP